jgi:hypothetical protein
MDWTIDRILGDKKTRIKGPVEKGEKARRVPSR